ncbi:MAG: acyl-CoA dehydrogenase family protein [Deltaproteobacteria bacterium]|nr:acyl-CoA dehydrogenase family protein [Deltaproteobacteria bacterium]MBW2445677.1 acyl-CoA dehydrogenase family protein [Deltaproteobacteria bacterium]
MIPYHSPIVDLYLKGMTDWEGYFTMRLGPDADVASERETLETVLETTAQICRELEPELRAGWHEAARLVDGEVVYPPAIQKAYETLAAAGLVSFGVENAYGGYGLPVWVTNVILQMIARADAGLMTIVGLQAGVADDLQAYASDELKERYLPGFSSGELMGAMDLTEPQAGSDLGAIRTRATETDGEVRLDGEKIFITNGGAGVHLVLARDDDTFEESAGTTSGLSLFLCPRVLPDGSANGLRVVRLEEKLGIHGSPTATIAFDSATAFRVGEKGQGFRAMLTLMNNARLGVAAQGVGIAEAALESAVVYARQRKQFGVPIGEQPLMKNIIARAITALEGSRALLYRACRLLDRNRAIEAMLARGEPNEGERTEWESVFERNQVRIRLLTPLAKYLATETSDDITRMAIQTHGGLGFMSESVPGKLHNDAIITTIYEGTSEIQVSFALKEVGKGALGVVFDEVRQELAGLVRPELQEHAKRVSKGIDQALEAAPALASDMAYALLSAGALAEIMASVIVSSELLLQADADPSRFDVAASWVERRMSDVETRTARIRAGNATLIERCERMIAQAVPE